MHGEKRKVNEVGKELTRIETKAYYQVFNRLIHNGQIIHRFGIFMRC